MTLEQIVDKKLSCGGVNADTGKLGCQIEWKTPLHLIGMKRGFIIPKATVFDRDYINAQIQLGNFIALIGATEIENMSSEDTFTTNTRGVERLDLLGLPKFKFTWEEGHEFYKEMSKLTSFKALDFIFADEEGNWRFAVTSDGDFKGFSTGQATALMTTPKIQGSTSESKAFTLQLLDRNQWDYNYTFALRSSLDFSPEEVDGVNGVAISFVEIPSAGTTVVVDVVLKADGFSPVEGLIVDDFIATNDGVTVTIASAVEDVAVAGRYTLTIPAFVLGDVIGVGTFDATVNKYVIINSGVLYRGEIVTETAVA